jgi:hypothetical protein
MAIILILIVLIGSIAFFYLKCSLMQSVSMFWASIMATVVAFSFYEVIASQLISRGYTLDWALFGCFLICFIVTLVAIKVGLDYLVPSGIDLGAPVKISAAVLCGLMTGIIISGNLLVAMGLLPKQGKIFYSRFDPEKVPALSRQNKPALNTDGFVAGLYSWVSSGSLSSRKSFSVLHADYLSQIHLNKLKAPKVLTVTASDAIQVPSGKTLRPVRYDSDRKYTIVRMGIKKRDVASQSVQFIPAQIRLVAKDSSTKNKPFIGSGTAFYPAGFWIDGSLQEKDLSETITPEMFGQDGPKLWLDVAFEVSEGLQPVLLQFKQNAAVDLSSYELVENAPDIEAALDSVQSGGTDNS